MRNCVSGRKSLRLRETITAEMYPATGRLSPGFIVDEVSIHVRLLLRRVASHRETRHRFGNRARGALYSGSNSSSQEMNPTLRKRLALRADCYALLSVFDENTRARETEGKRGREELLGIHGNATRTLTCRLSASVGIRKDYLRRLMLV